MLQFGHCTATILRLISPCWSYLCREVGSGQPPEKADHLRGGDASIWPLHNAKTVCARGLEPLGASGPTLARHSVAGLS